MGNAETLNSDYSHAQFPLLSQCGGLAGLAEDPEESRKAYPEGQWKPEARVGAQAMVVLAAFAQMGDHSLCQHQVALALPSVISKSLF